MKHVKVYNSAKRTKQVIPVAELAQGMVPCQTPDGSNAWIDALTVTIRTSPVHPPFDQSRRSILKNLKDTLEEVYHCTLEEWELGFRRDENPEREIRLWQWIADRYRHLVGTSVVSLKRKRDYFRLCVQWINCKNVEEAVASIELAELSCDEARRLLRSFVTTPTGFFGLGNLFPTAEVIDYSAIGSLEEFRALAEPASVIFAVDWLGKGSEVVFGSDSLRSIAESQRAETLNVQLFSVDFSTDRIKHLLAAVGIVKGHYEWKGEKRELGQSN